MIITLQLDSEEITDKHYRTFLMGTDIRPKDKIPECPVKWIDENSWTKIYCGIFSFKNIGKPLSTFIDWFLQVNTENKKEKEKE